MTLIYKILSRAEWDAAKAVGRFEGSAVDHQDGFIHLSAADQAQTTASLYFKGLPDLVLLGIEAEGLGDALKWETSRGGALFPHLYGDLRLDAVRSVTDLPIGPDGRHLFPADLVSPTPPSTGASA